jgi:hypothetical protein
LTGHARPVLVFFAVFACAVAGQQQPAPQSPSSRALAQRKIETRAPFQLPDEPSSREPAGVRPSQLARTQRFLAFNRATLFGPAAEARAFIDWAGQSRAQDREAVRSALVARRGDAAFAQALCSEAFAAKDADFTRALVTLSILGEMRSADGQQCLTRFVHLPLPQGGLVVEGENVEQTALASLQAKAIHGLAYLHTPSGDQEVLTAVQSHPSPIVRAAAIHSFLWNHASSPEARATLQKYVRPQETIFLDRVRREYGDTPQSFNNKLNNYLRLHPEVRVQPVERLQRSQVQQKQVVTDPGIIQQRTGIDRQREVMRKPNLPAISQVPPAR